ncbi:hypothetical protein BCR35DRAFT_350494 [Leucosporidium creatinivorum]|uniref:histidine kinase n=1 Tax=Leucosporidium creatinivorum TaxID=106004 RepID=A0A1Y2FY43_9BASI|nr:hypothetical protein BCR35DRAFT_350494 [Leucosporidium creatinivorum]
MKRDRMGNTINPPPSPPLQQPPSFDHFSLPALSFSANDLRLTYYNSTAARILELHSNTTNCLTAADFLCEEDDHDVAGRRALVHQQLDALSVAYAEREQYSFGEGALLRYWTGPTGKRTAHHVKVACISSAASDNSPSDLGSSKNATYSLLFLRPASTHVGDSGSSSSLASSNLSAASAALISSTSSSSSAPGPSITPAQIEHLFPKEENIEAHYKTIFRRVEEKTAETALPGGGLKLPETELVRLLDELPQICFVATPEGSTEFWNRMWSEYTGLGPDPSTWISAFHPDDLPGAIAHWEERVTSKSLVHYKYRVRGNDGIYRWHLCEGRPILNAEGEIARWVATITNVENLVTAKEEALRSGEYLDAIMRSAHAVLFCVDENHKITFFSGTSYSLRPPSPGKGDGHERRDEEMVGLPIQTVCADQHLADGCRKLLAEDLDTLDVECRTPEDRIYKYTLCPLAGPEGKKTGVILVGSDVTASKASEEALRRSHLEQARLQTSEHAAQEASRVKTVFVSNMSHELRTPVAGILGLAELLVEDPTLQAEHREIVTKIQRAGEILLELIGLVLDLAKIEADELTLERKEFKIAAVVDDVRLFSILATKNRVEFVEDLGEWYEGPLFGDLLRLRQSVSNGISNAIKFSKEGSVVFRVRQESETPDQVVISFPFRQADSSTAREYGGTGLGLVITKRLVELMGGTNSLTSTLRVGSTMTITVPFEKVPLDEPRPSEPATPTEVPSSSSATAFADSPGLRHSSTTASKQGKAQNQPSTNGEIAEVLEEPERRRRSKDVKILLAEDNELIREIVIRTLSKLGFQVEAVVDGTAAVDAVKAKHYDLILMDGQMPKCDGYEATKQIRHLDNPLKRQIRIVALTASAIVGDRERCIASGMDSYLSKPVRARDLDLKIWEQLLIAERTSKGSE